MLAKLCSMKHSISTDESNGKSRENILEEMALEIQSKIPKSFDLETMRKK